LGRRGSETLAVLSSTEEYELSHAVVPVDSCKTATNTTSSFWQSLFTVQAADVTCERGGWNVSDKRIVGLRRKPRSHGKAMGGAISRTNLTSPQGLTPATLERWELWIFDPSISQLRCSALAALTTRTDASHPLPIISNYRSSRDCIPRLPFTRISPFLITRKFGLAGFGNTVGVFHLPIS
jgi:hypothetical protein